ncbi:MAG: xanthine dehydrogenase family protein molybdopterin-binding subunit [Nitrospinota bacterium]|jgi:CO/xanthine dehydrogenase Mo-binding subunit|nr:xanthine dehydrogenase family protein molybdopterin-binding subunit [Nitrospinota bacterium]MDP6617849.1 xanthine dehydrogenase family protein molybdopterin-binding subunit [Nitrospinota bacterium]
MSVPEQTQASAGMGLIGRPVPAAGSPDKVSGAAAYVGDLRIPRMLHAKVLRSGVPHARIVEIDVSKALRLPGVKAVITGKDLPDILWGEIVKDQRTLPTAKIRFAGEDLAAVAAVDEATALDALELIRVEVEELPPVLGIEEAMAEGAPVVHDGVPDNVVKRFTITRGDLEAGFQQADVILEETYRTQRHHQSYMEPFGAVVEVDNSGRLTLHAGVQGIFHSRNHLAEALGISPSRVRVIQSWVGGAFGGKQTFRPLPILAAALARKTGCPVRLLNSRQDEFRGGSPRLPVKIHLRMGVRKDGTLTAKHGRVIGDAGAFATISPAILHTATMRMDNLYRIENLVNEASLVYTNHVPCGPFRGFGTVQGAFAIESLLDALAEAVDMDPAELRRRNFVRTGDTTVHGWHLGSCGIQDCLDTAVKASGWEDHNGRDDGGRFRRGFGLSAATHVSGNRHYGDLDASTCILKFNQDGKVNLINGEGELGQGAATVLSMCVAEELGLRPEDVTVARADTDTSPFAIGGYASRVTMIAGNAARLAALDARRQIFSRAAEMLEARPDQLALADGFVFVEGAPARRLSLSEVAHGELFRRGGRTIIGVGEYDAPTQMYDGETRYGNIAPGYEFTVQVAEVEVDTETGAVRVVRIVATDDAGRIINPLTAEGQVQGGIVMGLGMTLTETMKYEGGALVNGSFADYSLPRADSVPPIESHLIETSEPNGPYGAKGVSESCIDPVPSAITNAIHDAVGVRVTELPVSAEKVLRALRERG